MAAKRPAVEPGSGAPPVKRNSLAMSPLDIGPAAGEEDLDIKVLQVSNVVHYIEYTRYNIICLSKGTK